MSVEKNRRSVFYVSDRTGKTAESIGESLLSQFDSIEFSDKTFPFVTNEEKAKRTAERIQDEEKRTGQPPLVFSTLVNSELEAIIGQTNACVISLFNAFIEPLEASLGIKSSHTMGKPHEEFSDKDYKKRIDAIDFTMKNDDGIATTQYDKADVILLGVSRTAKTPTSLYLALNFSLKAANYPLTDDDLGENQIPSFLVPHLDKIVGLTIKADQLSKIRQQRRPKSEYASLKKCQQEIKQAEEIMANADLCVIDSSAMSIEEIAVNVVKEKRLLRKT
ncbi:MAG: pyruvate, water dikinase regulatory protein [Gammaproteobacteria bacterium]|jgi:regulator of PEP synthase PpsR (kinase-PPPase family)